MQSLEYEDKWDAVNYGVTAIPVLVCGFIIILISIYKVVRITLLNDTSKIGLNAIWLTGLIAFIVRLLDQMIYLSDIFKAISLAEKPDVAAIANGFSAAMLYPFYGFIILIASLVFYGVIKGLIVLKFRKLNMDKLTI